MPEYVVIVVFVPNSHAEVVRAALANGGAGEIGEYTACSFSTEGAGRFLPGELANPHIGTVGKPEVVAEVRIETVCLRERAGDAVRQMLAVHPYEEPAWHCYRALFLDDLS